MTPIWPHYTPCAMLSSYKTQGETVRLAWCNHLRMVLLYIGYDASSSLCWHSGTNQGVCCYAGRSCTRSKAWCKGNRYSQWYHLQYTHTVLCITSVTVCTVVYSVWCGVCVTMCHHQCSNQWHDHKCPYQCPLA